jgi:hypothetical protein
MFIDGFFIITPTTDKIMKKLDICHSKVDV